MQSNPHFKKMYHRYVLANFVEFLALLALVFLKVVLQPIEIFFSYLIKKLVPQLYKNWRRNMSQLMSDNIRKQLKKGKDIHEIAVDLLDCFGEKNLAVFLKILKQSLEPDDKLSMQAGGLVNVRRGSDGKTLLHLAARKAKTRSGKIILEYVLENGADLNIKDYFGKTALDYLPSNYEDLNQVVRHCIELFIKLEIPIDKSVRNWYNKTDNDGFRIEIFPRSYRDREMEWEIEKMRETKFGMLGNLADFAQKTDLNDLARFLKHPGCQKFCRDWLSTGKKSYFMYQNLITRKVDDGMRRRNLLDGSLKGIRRASKNILPNEICEKIAEKLTNYDLKNLRRV